MNITVVIRIIAGGLQFHPCYAWKGSAGIWRENDVVLMSMRREFAPTLIWRTAKCLLGRVDSHCTFLSESTFYWILKGEKERPISLFKCAGKYAHWSSFSICQNPTPIHFNKHPSIGIPHKPLSPSPLHTHTPHPLGILIKRSSWCKSYLCIDKIVLRSLFA